jgi:hypothetical protein
VRLRTDQVRGLQQANSYREINNEHKIQNKAWNSPQIKTLQQSHELKLIRALTKHTVPEHKQLKFLTPLTPSVDKTAKPYGFERII